MKNIKKRGKQKKRKKRFYIYVLKDRRLAFYRHNSVNSICNASDAERLEICSSCIKE